VRGGKERKERVMELETVGEGMNGGGEGGGKGRKGGGVEKSGVVWAVSERGGVVG